MLLIREFLRVARSTASMAVAGRRFGLAGVVILVAVVALATATVTIVGPVVLYPFL